MFDGLLITGFKTSEVSVKFLDAFELSNAFLLLFEEGVFFFGFRDSKLMPDASGCFKRHGCVACPLANPKTRVREYRIFPKWALADMRNVAEFMNTHPDSAVANTFDDEWEAFYFWIWGKSVDDFKAQKNTLFGKTDFCKIVTEQIGL